MTANAAVADATDRPGRRVLRCRACDLLYVDPRPAAGPSGLRTDAVMRAARGLPVGTRALAAACGPDWEGDLPRGWDIDLGAMECAPPAVYGAVVFAGTLERCPDPAGALARAGAALRPGGRVIVRADNADGAAGRLFAGRYWAGYAFPGRSQYFTPATLRATAARAGLRVERLVVRPDGRAWTSAVGHRRADVGAPANRIGRGRPPGRVADALGTLVDVAAALAGRGGRIDATLCVS
jgi:hypothetical protein